MKGNAAESRAANRKQKFTIAFDSGRVPEQNPEARVVTSFRVIQLAYTLMMFAFESIVHLREGSVRLVRPFQDISHNEL